jgi:hypothetical protein
MAKETTRQLSKPSCQNQSGDTRRTTLKLIANEKRKKPFVKIKNGKDKDGWREMKKI